MKLFENGVGRPSNETLRKRKSVKLVLFIGIAFLCSILIGVVFNFTSELIGLQKFTTTNTQVIPVYSANVSHSKSITINLKSNSNGYTSGQGMTRVNLNGKWYILTGVILNSKYSNRNTALTYMYIIEESTGVVKATIKDFCFGHINTIANDGSYIYIYGNGKLYKISIKYVEEAIANKFSRTKNYIVSEKSISKSLASLAYDKNSGKLYGSNKNNLYVIEPSTLKVNKVLSHQHIIPHYTEKKINDIDGEEANVENETQTKLEFAMTNSGAVIWKNYLLLGRFYLNGIGSSSTNRNTIDIYKLTFDSNKKITSSTYLATYIFNKGELLNSEIQDLEIDGDTLIMHYNGGSTNKIYYLDLKKLNFTKVKVLVNGKGVEEDSLKAVLYNSKGQVISNYKPNENSNLIIRNLAKGNYTLKIVSTKSNNAVLKDRVLSFTIDEYTPFQYIKIKA